MILLKNALDRSRGFYTAHFWDTQVALALWKARLQASVLGIFQQNLPYRVFASLTNEDIEETIEGINRVLDALA